jgi:hypothetical protein
MNNFEKQRNIYNENFDDSIGNYCDHRILFLMVGMSPAMSPLLSKNKVHGAQPPEVTETLPAPGGPVPVPYPKSRNQFKGAKGAQKKHGQKILFHLAAP